jgi:outer membrane immunogenic protein
MKNFLIASVAAVALSASPALAADMGVPYKAPPPPAPEISWTGCYVDGGYGYGFWDQNQFTETFPGLAQISANVDSGGRGWLGRFGGGCDYQFTLGNLGNFVVGALADYDWMDVHGQMSPGNTSLVGNEKESGAWYAGGRFGYLVTPALLTYFDAGYTETHYDQISLNLLTAPFTPGFDLIPAHTYSGWFIGGGTEYALNFSFLPIHGLFWRNEWRYASYDSADLPIETPAGGLTAVGMHANKDVQTITSSLVWRFNWPGH